MLKIKCFYFNPFRECCIVASDGSGEAVIVDPGCCNETETEALTSYIGSEGLNVRKILLTHGHFDHIFGVSELSSRYDVPVLMNLADMPIIEHVEVLCKAFGVPVPDISFAHDSSPMYLLADRLLKRGVKLDGLGLQFHLYGKLEDAIRMEIKSFFDPAHILQVLDQLGKLNLPIHISEISLPSYPELPGALAEEVQGELLRNFYRTWFSQKNCQSIVYWNLCDGTAYGTESRFNAGLISSDFKEKNAYRILDTLVNHEWHTETVMVTDENGEAVWNGFYGEYELDFCGKKETVALTPRSENEYLLSLSE